MLLSLLKSRNEGCVHFLGPVSPCYGCLVKLGVILYQIADTLVLLTSLLLGVQHSKASFLSAFNLFFKYFSLGFGFGTLT